MRIFGKNETVVLKTKEDATYQGKVVSSTNELIILRGVTGGDARFPELRFYDYEVISIRLTEEMGDVREREHVRLTEEMADVREREQFEDMEDFVDCKEESDSRIVPAKETNETHKMVHRKGKQPVASVKSTPPHLRLWPLSSGKKEELMALAVQREMEGENVALEMEKLSIETLSDYLKYIKLSSARPLQNEVVPEAFILIEDEKSAEYKVCMRHIKESSEISVSWEGIMTKESDEQKHISLLCISTPYLVCMFDILLLLGASPNLPPDLAAIISGQSVPSQIIVTYDGRGLAHSCLYAWDVPLSTRTVDLQVLNAKVHCLLSVDMRRRDGSIVQQSPTLFKMIENDLKLFRNPLFIRERHRLEDMSLWMKRPVCNVLLNLAGFQARYLIALYRKQLLRLMGPVMINSECRWRSTLLGEEGGVIDPCYVNLKFSDPLRVWRTLPLNNNSRSVFHDQWKLKKKHIQNSITENEDKTKNCRNGYSNGCVERFTESDSPDDLEDNLSHPNLNMRYERQKGDARMRSAKRLNEISACKPAAFASSSMTSEEGTTQIRSIKLNSSPQMNGEWLMDRPTVIEDSQTNDEACDEDFGVIPSRRTAEKRRTLPNFSSLSVRTEHESASPRINEEEKQQSVNVRKSDSFLMLPASRGRGIGIRFRAANEQKS